MKTIVAPTDFSSVSLNAVNYAADLSLATSAELLLMNIIALPLLVASVPLAGISNVEMRYDEQKKLSDLKKSLLSRTNDAITINSVSEFGSLENQLETYAYKKILWQ